MDRVYYFTGDANVKSDALSDFLYKCRITPKSAGYQNRSRDTTEGVRFIGDMELIYFVGGSSSITINGNRRVCGAGDVVIVPQYVFYTIESSESDPHENYWLHFDIENIVYQKQLVSLISGTCVSNIGVDAELIGMYRKLLSEYADQRDGSRAVIDSLVMQIFTLIIRRAGAAGNAHDGSGIGDIVRVKNPAAVRVLEGCLRYIAEMKGAVTVGGVCSQMYISPSYLRRLFDAHIGVSPLDFIRATRIRQAQTLLLSTDKSITAIAAELGYSSAYHFSRDFSKATGISASSFRKNAGASD